MNKTPKAQRRTPNVEFGSWRVAEISDGEYARTSKPKLLRCGTSSLSNHGEVEAAESRRDFLHKLRICLKDLRETKRWLRLVGRVNKIGTPANFAGCVNEVEELIRIFVTSIRTAERNAK